jgi:hypothetical protein
MLTNRPALKVLGVLWTIAVCQRKLLRILQKQKPRSTGSVQQIGNSLQRSPFLLLRVLPHTLWLQTANNEIQDTLQQVREEEWEREGEGYNKQQRGWSGQVRGRT